MRTIYDLITMFCSNLERIKENDNYNRYKEQLNNDMTDMTETSPSRTGWSPLDFIISIATLVKKVFLGVSRAGRLITTAMAKHAREWLQQPRDSSDSVLEIIGTSLSKAGRSKLRVRERGIASPVQIDHFLTDHPVVFEPPRILAVQLLQKSSPLCIQHPGITRHVLCRSLGNQYGPGHLYHQSKNRGS